MFLAVVEERGFAGAQARLNVARSTLSEHIKDLELRVGFPVCIRGRRNFRLTPTGEQLYQAARQLVATMDGFSREVGRIGETVGANVEFGLIDSVDPVVRLALASVLHRLKMRRPDFRVRLTILPPPQLLDALQQGRLDAAVGPFTKLSGRLVHRPIFREAQSLYCGRGHELFTLEDEELSPDVIMNSAFIEIAYPGQFNRSAFRPRHIAGSVQSMDALLTLLLSGNYIGYLPEHIARGWVGEGYLRCMLPQHYRYEAQFAAVWRREHVENQTLRRFFEWFQQDYNPSARFEPSAAFSADLHSRGESTAERSNRIRPATETKR